MKKKQVSHLSDHEKCFLYLESFQIYFYLILSVLQLAFSLKMYAFWGKNSVSYYYYLLNTRITPEKYISEISFLNDTSLNCSSNGLDQTFAKYEFMGIGGFSKAKIIDTSNSTIVSTAGNKTFLQNHSLAGLTYYNIDISAEGTESITLQTKYPMTAWRNYSFCVRELILDDEGEAFQIIPKEKECKEVFGNYAVDCGTYRSLFKLCIRKDYLFLPPKYDKYLDFDISNNDSRICPFNNMEFGSYSNKDYDSSDPNSNMYWLLFDGVKRNFPTKPDNKDKFLFVNFGMMMMDGAPNITNFEEAFLYNIQSPSIMEMGIPYGYRDSFTYVVDTYTWLDFYNETQAYLYWTSNSSYHAQVGFLLGSDLAGNYRPLNLSKNINISLTLFQYDLISENCYKNVFVSNSRTDVLGLTYTNKSGFLTETTGMIICWSIVSIFVSFFNQIYIRFYIIYCKLKDKLTAEDKESEFISKLIVKILQLIIFLVQIFSVCFNRSQFNRKINNLKLATENGCFSNKSLVNAIEYYIIFLETLSTDNTLILMFVIISGLGEVWVGFSYFFTWYSEYKELQEKIKEEEAKRKEEEILKRAMKNKEE